MQSCVLKVISVLFYCLFLNYSGMTMATEIIHLFFKNSFVMHSFVIFLLFYKYVYGTLSNCNLMFIV